MGLSTISLIELDPDKLVEDVGAKTVAFFVLRPPVLIDARLIAELKQISTQRDNSNVRICLHESPEAEHHDMVALERKGRYYRPHKHFNKGDTSHMLEGRLRVFSFDTEGEVIDAVAIGPGEIYRTATNMYHAILPLTDYVIHHESKPGPFEGENDSIYPDWAPDGSDQAEVDAYIGTLTAQLPNTAR
jgi:cupin fold WbuC family metalloprotein